MKSKSINTYLGKHTQHTQHTPAGNWNEIYKYTYISINTLSKFFEHNIRIGYSKTQLVKKLDEIKHNKKLVFLLKY